MIEGPRCELIQTFEGLGRGNPQLYLLKAEM